MARTRPLPPDARFAERALLARVVRGEPAAWREFLARYRGLIHRCITRVTARYAGVLGAADVDDIYAEVCLQLWRDDRRKLRAWDPRRGSRLTTFLGLIATHAAYDELRRAARRPADDGRGDRDGEAAAAEVHDRHAPSPLELLLEAERRAALRRMTAGLTARDREFVELYFVAGAAPDQVASRLGISLKTVYSKKHKIQTRLRAWSEAGLPDAAAAA